MNMRSKILLSILTIATLTFSLGCGGGGGGGGGAVPPTTYKVSGTVKAPDALSAQWKPSVRGSVDLGTLVLKAAVYSAANTKISEEQNVGSDGTFSLTASPDSDAIVKVSNGTGLEFRFHLGLLAAPQVDLDVGATSTARAFMNWRQPIQIFLGDNDPVLIELAKLITDNLLAPTDAKSLEELVKATVDARRAASNYIVMNTAIEGRNQELQDIFDYAAKNSIPSKLGEALDYFTANVILHLPTRTTTTSGSDIISATKTRYGNYNVNTYSFQKQTIRFTSTTTASVTVSLQISITPKPTYSSGVSGSFGPVSKVIGWQKGNDGKWRISQDFPYLREQFGF